MGSKRISLAIPDAEGAIEFVKQIAGQRYLPDNTAFAALEGDEVGGTRLEVKPDRRQSENF
ncbi:hypothetical protein GCM10007857_64650 [Bradyrhizobium iriomotense]|uniref:Uncharacterized protein n=1 Tax=Bradyrhizobium iriomotense TaxID=441950 RepID=A0ABQ6BAT6_9BRAD|nr:hypothetical protein GCM10007857_64650 [Bradyrhizobium iriomotense]